MIIEKKYTAILIHTKVTKSTLINERVDIELTYGEITGPYYDETEPKQEFDTEKEAIEYAYNIDKWARWLIVPVIKFDNH